MAALISAIPAFIAALPELLRLAAQLMALTCKLVAWAERVGMSKWMESVETQIDTLEKAVTPDDKKNAARGLSDILRSLG